MENKTITVEGLNVNREKETIKISNLQATGDGNIDKILNIIYPRSIGGEHGCDHYDHSLNMVSLVANMDGTVTCSKCGAIIKDTVTLTSDDIEVINNAKNILQILKTTISLTREKDDNADDEIKLIASILESLEEIPQLIKKTNNSFKMLEAKSIRQTFPRPFDSFPYGVQSPYNQNYFGGFGFYPPFNNSKK